MNSLSSQLCAEITGSGPISFARFMERALYEPDLGYYEKLPAIGKQGDFFTSVSAGSLFGELLAFQFLRSFPDEPLELVEAGAHDGRLAADILGWFQRRAPEILPRVRYCIIEPSGARREWQGAALHSWKPNVVWMDALESLPASATARIIFSNELLDAFPLRRFCWNASTRAWQELLVGLSGEKFCWVRDSKPAEQAEILPGVSSELARVLPEGYTIETPTVAVAWWGAAAEKIQRGKLLAFDYGYTDENWLRPERTHGTLRTFSHHKVGDDLLAEPGECDITADVNFSALQRAGESFGLKTETLLEQGRFLTQIVAAIQAAPASFDPWTSSHTRQFQTLTHPEQLGHSFRVLVQTRQ